MFMLEGRSARAQLRQQDELDLLLQELVRSGYTPVLRAGARAMLEASGKFEELCSSAVISILVSMMADIPPMRGRSTIIGDLFFDAERAFIIQPTSTNLTVWEIRAHTNETRLETLCEDVANAARVRLDGRRLRGMDFDWQHTPMPIPRRRRRMYGYTPRKQRPELSTQSIILPEEDARNAELLVNAERRAFLHRLAQLGKARSVDAQADTDVGLVAPLLDRHIIRREYLVLCKQDSHTVCTVESQDEIQGERGRRFRCSICGRPFAEEKIQEVYGPTETARKLLNASHWMTVWVTTKLTDAGVEAENISWGATAGEDELDIIAAVQGQNVFFELKDREFGLGDAYPFSSRIQRYGGDAGVIITMDNVAHEVKKFLQEQERTSGRKIYTLEGAIEIEEQLPRVLDEIARAAVVTGVQGIFEAWDLGIDALLRNWLR